jgi:type VI secretion system protein ImpH
VDWVRLYQGHELDWDLRLRLARAEVPRLTLGTQGRLGWTTWLGRRPTATDADDLCFPADSCVSPQRAAVDAARAA